MLVLVLDSATPAVTAALVTVTADGVELVAQRVTVDGKAHGELLAPQIEQVLQEGGVRPERLAAVVADVGPGPFTGLRVGLVTALATGHTLGVPCYGVCSLDALAHGLPGRVLAATDARRKEVYWARYVDGARVDGPHVSRPDAVDVEGEASAVGDGALRYAEVLGLPVLDAPRYPDALALARLAADRVRSDAPAEPLTPLYLRRPDAVPTAERKPVLSKPKPALQ